MKKNTKSDNYLEGYLLASLNAKSLFNMAEVVAIKHEYGIASSLNILSAEEAIKAFVIATKHYRPYIEIQDFDKLFRSHPTKHLHIQWLTAAYEMMLNYWQGLLGVELNENDFEAEDFLDEKHQTGILRIIRVINSNKRKSKDFKDALEWWLRANNEKNNGFYVDYRNGKWLTPQDKSRVDYTTERSYSELIIECLETMIAVFRMNSASEVEKIYKEIDQKINSVSK